LRTGAGPWLGHPASVEKGDKPFNRTNPSGALTQGKVPSKLRSAHKNGSEVESGMYQSEHLWSGEVALLELRVCE